MATSILTEQEYSFITGLEKDLLERAKTATPRAATHLRAAAKIHSDFLAKENGKRAATSTKEQARNEREAARLERQRQRLAALQEKMKAPATPGMPAPEPATASGNTGRQRNQASV